MRIFEIGCGEGYELAQPVNPDDYDVLRSQLNEDSRRVDWRPVRVELLTQDDRRRRRRESDSPWMVSYALVFKPRVIQGLKSFLLEHGELLPLECEQEEDLVLFNPLRVVDALDEKASVVKRFSDGRIWWIERHVFRPDVVRGLPIFKITSLQPSSVFASEEFVGRWEGAGLKGLDFKQVWEG